MIHISAKHKKLVVPAEGALIQIFEGQPQVTLAGKPYFVVDHGNDETKLLRNLGFETPSPVLHHYDWEGGTPFRAQKLTTALMADNHRAYVLNEFGTGKTRSALWAWRYLNRESKAGKMLVVAPLSTLTFTWVREAFATMPDVKVKVLHGTRKKRLERLADTSVDVYVINHDGVAVIREELEKRDDIDTLVLDELAVYRNPTAARTKLMKRLTPRFRWVWGMTGSPTPNAPTDAWAQCILITPNTVPKFYKAFREETMLRVNQFKFVPKPSAIHRVHEVMQPAVRFTLDDIVELPEIVERVVDVDMGTEQKRIYDTMYRHAKVMAQNHQITAMNAGVVLMKLLQISTGYVYTSDSRIVGMDNELRLQALGDAVASAANKVIVFCPFKHALAGVTNYLTDEGNSVAPVSGDTSKGERDQIFNEFQNHADPRILVAHPGCMSHGLTLTAADTIIWFGPTTSLETFEQANARIRRVGQHHKQQILMFQSTAVERKMYARLRAKQNVQNQLLDLFEDTSDETVSEGV